jgi:regulator of protease activity HflC (stomatin/prohibitin superfamily)
MESLLQVIPRLRHVKSTHGAVLFWWGRSYLLKSGLHVYWPVCSEIVEASMVRRTHNLTYQDLVTSDDVQATIAVTVVYQIVDVHAAITKTDDIADTISDLAGRAIIEICGDSTAKEVRRRRKDDGRKIDLLLRRMMSHDLAEFGVKVRRAFICEVSTPRMIRLISNHGSFN